MDKDLVLLIVGVILGFGSSIGTLKYQEYSKRIKSLKLLKIEIIKIDKLISPFASKIPNNIVHPITGETSQFNGISITEISNFKMIMQIDQFLSLKNSLRESIYSIFLDLESAEKHRVLAIPLLNQEERVSELNMFATIYLDYLISAKDKIDNLKNKI